ncbi:geranylgeranylglyceryl/heptaprenylglyceryl phosphate synthase [Sungkyunkwania multivorans]|uniref:Geranylgeranylglyceryl phosphate synthase n=1 Tax=Sungkyunkwania multivorans TaxID=1173618 RepID=A0ABW3D387_9FLAO
MSILEDIIKAKGDRKKLLAVLIDPDKISVHAVPDFMDKVNASIATHVFVGGSTVANGLTEKIVLAIKTFTDLPVILFPGDAIQITDEAHGILFLSLISGRNPEYLIGQHVKSIAKLKNTSLEIIPTGYILIDGGNETAVQRVSKTTPIPRNDNEMAVETALAGQFSGKQLIYLEAGSGAKHPVPSRMIAEVVDELSVPVIVGGGIRDVNALEKAYAAGATLVVIGTILEDDEAFFEKLKKNRMPRMHE